MAQRVRAPKPRGFRGREAESPPVSFAVSSSPMASPWDEVRQDFPCLQSQVYLNAAAAGPAPRPVRAAGDAFYHTLDDGGDRDGDQWLEQTEAGREKGRRLVGAEG